MKPSMRMAEWIYDQMNLNGCNMAYSADDVYDTLLGTITTPQELVSEVQYWHTEYIEDFRRHNAR